MIMINPPEFTERYDGVEDRTGWPPGPWDREPDKVVWVDPPTGLDCMARRGGGGAWCGYVGVRADHPLHGCGYDEVDLDCHGGPTFAAACNETTDPAAGVCHLSDQGPVWWFGFDCSHFRDLRPGSLRFYDALPGERYRDLPYVVTEVRSLAKQLHETAAWRCRARGDRMTPDEMKTEAENHTLLALVREFTDPEPCHYDHHGYCQAHSLHERPCPHERAKALLA